MVARQPAATACASRARTSRSAASRCATAKRDGFALGGRGFRIAADARRRLRPLRLLGHGACRTDRPAGAGNVAERSGDAGFNIMGGGHAWPTARRAFGSKAGVHLQALDLDVRGCRATDNGGDGIEGVGSQWRLAGNEALRNGGDGIARARRRPARRGRQPRRRQPRRRRHARGRPVRHLRARRARCERRAGAAMTIALADRSCVPCRGGVPPLTAAADRAAAGTGRELDGGRRPPPREDLSGEELRPRPRAGEPHRRHRRGAEPSPGSGARLGPRRRDDLDAQDQRPHRERLHLRRQVRPRLRRRAPRAPPATA